MEGEKAVNHTYAEPGSVRPCWREWEQSEAIGQPHMVRFIAIFYLFMHCEYLHCVMNIERII